MSKIITFGKECVAELRKVVWPTRDDGISAVTVVDFSLMTDARVTRLKDWKIMPILRRKRRNKPTCWTRDRLLSKKLIITTCINILNFKSYEICKF